jgi:D-arabinose 5-phosphate isomerase GutQ
LSTKAEVEAEAEAIKHKNRKTRSKYCSDLLLIKLFEEVAFLFSKSIKVQFFNFLMAN